MRPHASVWSMESFFVRFFVPAAWRASVVTVLFIPVRVQGHQEGLADHQQHRHHEGRSQGVLVRPHRRVPVLVQRRRGEPPPSCQRFTFKVRHRDHNIVHDSMNFLLSCGDFFFHQLRKTKRVISEEFGRRGVSSSSSQTSSRDILDVSFPLSNPK